MRKTRKLVGYVSVDSGCVVISDPCNVHTIPSTAEQTEKYLSLYGQLTPHVVFSSTGFGDGRYPVYAEVLAEHVVALHIMFVDMRREKKAVARG